MIDHARMFADALNKAGLVPAVSFRPLRRAMSQLLSTMQRLSKAGLADKDGSGRENHAAVALLYWLSYGLFIHKYGPAMAVDIDRAAEQIAKSLSQEVFTRSRDNASPS